MFDANPPENSERTAVTAQSYLLGGVTYPLWYLFEPDANDSLWPWLVISALLLASAATARFGRLTPAKSDQLNVFLGSAVTLHFFVLASLNDMRPFYAVGSTLAILATSPFLRSTGSIRFYGAFVVILASVSFLAAPDARKLAYWAALLPTLAFAYHRIQTQVEQKRRLEEEVALRTRQLEEANRRLREEAIERARLEEEARVHHKVEAAGRLASAVAHDFNNLLTTIGIYAELLREGLPASSPLSHEVDQIEQAQRQAASLTQQLLTLGRRSQADLEGLDLNAMVSEQDSLFRRILADHELVFDLCEGELWIHANGAELRQALLNLVVNARDAMEGPGRVTIETATLSSDDVAATLGRSSGDVVLLAVTDTGAGMDAKTRARVFDPFFTTKSPEHGTGLGLSTVYGILQRADGHVRVKSGPGRGARFELYWPVASRSPAPIAPDPPRVESRSPSARVLLVEDEAPLRDALERVLIAAGHRVKCAEDGSKALGMLGEDFDVVITDVVMPGINGFELADHVTARQDGTKVILISAHLSDRSLVYWDGRHAFLPKPFTPDDLMRKIDTVLSGPSVARAGPP
jgi:signal transduction histidine kinase/ActR/RegA family two-component response regulator